MELTEQHYVYMNFGRRFWDAELSRLSVQQREVLRSYVSSFRKMIGDGVGLYLCGPNGSGKTYVAAALVRYAWEKWRVTGYCIPMAELKEAWIVDRPATPNSDETITFRVHFARILVLDDVGKEHRANSGFAETQFGALIRYRSRMLLTTIITTNLRPKEFAGIYGESTANLLKECSHVVLLKDGDHRDDKAREISTNLR